MKRTRILSTLIFFAAAAMAAEQAPTQAKDATTTTASKPVMSPTARLQAAKTALVKRVEGSTIGSETVMTTLEGWGRYKLVNDAEKADLLIEVSSPSDSEGGVSVSSSTSTPGGKYDQSTRTSRDLSPGGGTMRVVVRDAKTTATLWAASEPVKGALKKNARENNLVEAAQKLMAKFHDRVEPIKPE